MSQNPPPEQSGATPAGEEPQNATPIEPPERRNGKRPVNRQRSLYRRARRRLPELTFALILGLTVITGVTVREVDQNGKITQAVAAEQAGLRSTVNRIDSKLPPSAQEDEGQDERASLLLKLIEKLQQVVAKVCTPKEVESSMKVYVDRLDKSHATLYNSRRQFPHTASDDHATRVALERLKTNIRELIGRLDKSSGMGRPEIRQLQSWLLLALGYADALLALTPGAPAEGIRWERPEPGRGQFSYLRAAEGKEEPRAWKTSEAIDGMNDVIEFVIKTCALVGRG